MTARGYKRSLQVGVVWLLIALWHADILSRPDDRFGPVALHAVITAALMLLALGQLRLWAPRFQPWPQPAGLEPRFSSRDEWWQAVTAGRHLLRVLAVVAATTGLLAALLATLDLGVRRATALLPLSAAVAFWWLAGSSVAAQDED